MAGRKATGEEKRQIRSLLGEGANLQDLQSRYPDIDGRVLVGLQRHHSHGGPPGAAPAPADPSGLSPLPTDLKAPPPASPGLSPVVTPAVSLGIPPTVLEDAAKTGFTPAAASSPNLPSGAGLRPSYREYFIVKKLDAPNDGVKGQEYPPFGITELMDRYPPGDYEVLHYRDGRHYSTYRDKVATKAGAQAVRTDSMGRPATEPNPHELFLKAIDIAHRMHSEGKRETASVEAITAQAAAAREAGKTQVEATAMQGLVSIVTEAVKPKPEAPRPEKDMVDKMLLMMQEERKTAELKHQHEMEALEKKSKLESERERERMKMEQENFRRDMDSRERMQKEFLAKMHDLDKDRVKHNEEIQGKREDIWQKNNERIMEKMNDHAKTLDSELAARKEMFEQQRTMQKEHDAELEKMRESSGSGDKDIEMARVIKDGITGAIDRVGARLDMAIEHGVIPGGKNGTGKPATVIGRIPASSAQPPISQNPQPEDGEEKVSMKDLIQDAMKQEWFVNLKREILFTVKRRIEIEADPATLGPMKKAIKPHGSLQAQTFIDEMNEDQKLRRYGGYFCSRLWFSKEEDGLKYPGIFEDLEPSLSEGERKIFVHPEAESWWDEFQKFFAASWNASVHGIPAT